MGPTTEDLIGAAVDALTFVATVAMVTLFIATGAWWAMPVALYLGNALVRS